MFKTEKYLFLFFFLLTGHFSFGQVKPTATPAADTITEYHILRGPSMRAIKIDSATTLQSLCRRCENFQSPFVGYNQDRR